MSSFSAIDLAALPAPDVIESLDYEAILAELVNQMAKALADVLPAWDPTLESDPILMQLQIVAYRELLLRQRVNDAGRAVMLAFAGGRDLDHLCALVQVERAVIDLGDPDADPPVPPTYEADADLRRRAQMAMEAITTAGSAGSYVWHALSASGRVRDAWPVSPTPGRVEVYVLSDDGDGTADQALLDTVAAALTASEVRPLTDQVTVHAAGVVSYTIEATLTLAPDAAEADTLAAAEAAVRRLADAQRRLHGSVPLSAIYAALHARGVAAVELAAPAGTVATTATQAPYCTAINLTSRRS